MPSHQPNMTLWCKHYCPYCAAKNWTCHGSTQSDGTDADVGSCRCWNCGAIYWLLDEELADDIYSGDIEQSNTAIGEESP